LATAYQFTTLFAPKNEWLSPLERIPERTRGLPEKPILPVDLLTGSRDTPP
jgi:hypothetical protein